MANFLGNQSIVFTLKEPQILPRLLRMDPIGFL